MTDGTPTLRQQLEHLRLGCHDTLSAFGPYRMMHGKHWAQHSQSGWYVIPLYRYEHLLTASDRGEILNIEDNSDRFQVWAARLVTVIIGSLTGMAALVTLT